METRPLTLIVISSVRPEPTSGGELVLWRHLIGHNGLSLKILGSAGSRPGNTLFQRVVSRLERSRFRPWLGDFNATAAGRGLDHGLTAPDPGLGRSIVLTVAHGDACFAAMRYSKKHRLPLVTIFHDWWPDIPYLHRPFRKLLERNFRKLYRESSAALCVCEGMRDALGPHANAHILHPIPASEPCATGRVKVRGERFHFIYSGNLWDYGPMLGNLIREMANAPSLKLEVRGAKPRWDQELKDYAAAQGIWHDFAPRAELEAWLETADAFLIPMVFDPAVRRRMETSFPSKLTELSRYGKPLVVWGPAYCSAAKWAKETSSALLVSDPSPLAVIAAMQELSNSGDLLRQFSSEASRAASMEFSPESLQQDFRRVLDAVADAECPADKFSN